MRRWLLGLVALLAPAAAADEPDAAVADALRWSDPRGAVSGSRRSSALPLTGVVEEAWHARLPHAVAAPPVSWEGRLYLVARDDEDAAYLYGLDLFSGRVLGRRRIGAGSVSPPVVWDHRVVLRTHDDEYGEYKLVGTTFNQVWRHRPGLGTLSDPVAFRSEIYGVAGGAVVKMRPGRARPVWTAPGRYRGRPAVWGQRLYVLFDGEVPGYDTSLHVGTLSRRHGGLLASTNVGWYAGRAVPPLQAPGEITVTARRVYVRAPAALAVQPGTAPVHFASVARDDGDRLEGPARLHTFHTSPAAHADGLLALEKAGGLRWVLWGAEKGAILAEHRHQADLFEKTVPPTLLGDIAYFGGWAADLETLEVLWRLPRAPRFPVLPADRMVVVVDGPRDVRAYRESR